MGKLLKSIVKTCVDIIVRKSILASLSIAMCYVKTTSLWITPTFGGSTSESWGYFEKGRKMLLLSV